MILQERADSHPGISVSFDRVSVNRENVVAARRIGNR